MPYHVFARATRYGGRENTGKGNTPQEARDDARWWLLKHGKPGEAVAEIFDEDSTTVILTMSLDADSLIHEDADGDTNQVRLVRDHLREITGVNVVPGRFDFDRKEYRFEIYGGYTVAATRAFLRETSDLPATLKSHVTLEKIRNTGTKQTLVLMSEGIKPRPNQA